jgi:hypothetical protein
MIADRGPTPPVRRGRLTIRVPIKKASDNVPDNIENPERATQTIMLIFGFAIFNFASGYPARKTKRRSPGAACAGVSRM